MLYSLPGALCLCRGGAEGAMTVLQDGSGTGEMLEGAGDVEGSWISSSSRVRVSSSGTRTWCPGVRLTSDPSRSESTVVSDRLGGSGESSGLPAGVPPLTVFK